MIYAQLEGGVRSRQAHIREDSPTGGTVVGITHETLITMISQKKSDELLALYCFYAAKVQDQGTQQIWCTTGYVAKGLDWGEAKVKRVKKRLIALKLIEDIPGKNVGGKFTKPFIRVRFVNKGYVFQPGGENEPVVKAAPSAPRTKRSALRTKEKSSKTYTQADARDDGFEGDLTEGTEAWVVINYNNILAQEGSEFLPVNRCTPELRKALLIAQDWDCDHLDEVFKSAKERRRNGCNSVTLVRILWDHYETECDFTPELTQPTDDEF